MKEIIINVTGNLDPFNGSELYLHIKEILAEPHLILLDFTQVENIDEIGQVYLQKISAKVKIPSKVAVCSLASHLQEKLGVEGQEILPVFADRKEAITFLTKIEKEENEKETTVFSYCPVCGTGLRIRPGNAICQGCGSKIYVHNSGRITAYERLF